MATVTVIRKHKIVFLKSIRQRKYFFMGMILCFCIQVFGNSFVVYIPNTSGIEEKIVRKELEARVPVYYKFRSGIVTRVDEQTYTLLQNRNLKTYFIGSGTEKNSHEFFICVNPSTAAFKKMKTSICVDLGVWIARMDEEDTHILNDQGDKIFPVPETPAMHLGETIEYRPIVLQKDSTIAKIINSVNTDTLKTILKLIQDKYYTRTCASEGLTKAEEWAYNYYKSCGVDSVSYHEYKYGGRTQRNVIATKVGVEKPDSVIMLSGHLDSPPSSGPGIDDDMSGTLCAMEAARIISRYKTRWTIKFIAWTSEERYAPGGYEYVKNVVVGGKMGLNGLYECDMIGNHPFPDTTLHYVQPNSSSTVLAQMAAEVNKTYSIGMNLNTKVETPSGDHAPFWKSGYKAVFVTQARQTEIWGGCSPHYHTSRDKVDVIDYPFFPMIVKVMVGTIATWAGARTGTTEINYNSGIASRPSVSFERNKNGITVHSRIKASVQVSDIRGRVMHSIPDSYTIKINAPTPGVYVFQVKAGGKMISHRVINILK